MKQFLYILLFLSFTGSFAQEKNIPEGQIKGPFVWKSKIYPGTERNYWVYVPQQYDGSKPACLMVVQDGLSRAQGWKLTAVLDSLIELKEIPVMIGVFVDHGTVAGIGDNSYPRYNRSFEYDATGDRYARFLLEELLPEISKTYSISADPNDRSIAGASSGAIAAFNVAWERPDSFRRVLSTIGSFVGLRGGEEFPKLIRVAEPKPIRIFLEDGSNDLDIYAGGWWTANQSILSALKWAGYEVNHNWGDGGHNSDHAAEILPEALVWLWDNYPNGVQNHSDVTPRRLDLVEKSENWTEVPLPNIKVDQLAVNKEGQVYFTSGKSIYKIDPNRKSDLFATLKGNSGGLSFHSDGRLYVADLENQKIVSIDEKGFTKDVVTKVKADFLTVSDKGIYFSEALQNRVGFFKFADNKISYVEISGKPSGLAISAEQTFLNVGLSEGLFGHSFKIREDGILEDGQEYIHYHKPYGIPFPLTKGMAVDAENNVYSATAYGIQVSDQLGRINFIFSNPGKNAVDVKFAGKDFSNLYLSTDRKLFTRKIKAKGVLSWLPPVTPPKPGL